MCFFPLSVQDGLAADFRSLTKTLYDLHKVLGADAIHGSPLKELVIESFDEEQIWQQLELQNDAVLDYFKNEVARNVKDKDLCLIPVQEEDGSDAETSSEKEMEPEDSMEADQISDDAEDESEDTEKQTKSRTLKRQQYSDEDSDIDFDIDELEEETKKSKMTTSKKTGEKSIVDDKFFKLCEMEAFLDDLEKTERREMEEDDDEINYFEDIHSEEEDEEELGKDKVKVKVLKATRQ